ncbi:type I glyceraldehyde-3-phosphate dehydrogenase [Candidatus Odyssella thessalonicensis]|uniref:type I glyceraldehyde-3-phosphate dehydrogenase n=1 Tax=Candidatus Odyssella thessalonicensis TaxID=84647 RepID=UPI000225C05A|nr:type I glyceraldehyde-3-phosphate dehydrogenase [Candidatus Odyssella thessalonicensis]
MTIRVAINGFGRIGRMILRALAENKRSEFQVVAINDLGSLEANAHLFKYDSIHGRFPGTVNTTVDTMDVGLGPIKIIAEANPANLPWKELGIDIVLECSGRFTDKDKAAQHLAAGAKKVIVSAPSKGADATIVMGVNHETLTKDHQVISCGSCTTNCLAPVAKVLNDEIGIEMGYMTTIHAYTGDQRLVDTLHSDMHRARAAAMSMIPSTTGAAKALGLVLPELQGKLDGCAVRVPTANVSMIDLTFVARQATTAQQINDVMVKAAAGAMGKILAINSEPLVSIDFNHSPYSSNFDTTQTQVVGDKFCRVVSWYDNEWGFSNRMGDLTALVARSL